MLLVLANEEGPGFRPRINDRMVSGRIHFYLVHWIDVMIAKCWEDCDVAQLICNFKGYLFHNISNLLGTYVVDVVGHVVATPQDHIRLYIILDIP